MVFPDTIMVTDDRTMRARAAQADNREPVKEACATGRASPPTAIMVKLIHDAAGSSPARLPEET